MTEQAISPLRRRLIEDMAIRRLHPKTQQQYIRYVKKFADFVGRSAEKATPEDVRRYQVWLASIGTTAPTVNVSATALRFFFRVMLKRHDLAEELVSTREPRRLPVVLSPEEVGRLLTSATNIKHKALLSLAYATGLRASEVVSLKLTDIDRHRMVIRVEQGKSLPLRKRGARRRRAITAGRDAIQEIQEIQKIGLQVHFVVCRGDTVDAGSTVLAGQPIGLGHPVPIDDVVERLQRHPPFRPRQTGDPLSVRRQVCGVQSPLPCVSSTVLYS